MRVKEKYKYKLLVEGSDDRFVVLELRKKLNITDNFDVIDCGGIEPLLNDLKIRLKGNSEDTRKIAIVIDADLDLDKQWKRVKSIIKNSNKYDSIDQLPKAGLVLKPKDDSDMTIGVWIMPDNNEKDGMLEDFMANMISKDDELIKYVDQSLENIEKSGKNKYDKDIHKAKARIHTWLSWQKDPGTPMGQAITKRYFNASNDNCSSFVEWLKNMFQ